LFAIQFVKVWKQFKLAVKHDLLFLKHLKLLFDKLSFNLNFPHVLMFFVKLELKSKLLLALLLLIKLLRE